MFKLCVLHMAVERRPSSTYNVYCSLCRRYVAVITLTQKKTTARSHIFTCIHFSCFVSHVIRFCACVWARESLSVCMYGWIIRLCLLFFCSELYCLQPHALYSIIQKASKKRTKLTAFASISTLHFYWLLINCIKSFSTINLIRVILHYKQKNWKRNFLFSPQHLSDFFAASSYFHRFIYTFLNGKLYSMGILFLDVHKFYRKCFWHPFLTWWQQTVNWVDRNECFI